MTIVVVHLYPRELGINGDVGNVLALRRRAQWRGVDVSVVDHEIGAELPEVAHLVHIGSGPVSAQDLVRDDLDRVGPRLRKWADAGVPFLAIAGGWQLLGQSITSSEGVERPGVGVFPTTARLTTERAVDEVIATSRLGEIGGFENHGAITTLLAGAEPLAVTRHGQGNAAGGGARSGAAEGVLSGASVGTNLHGPFLPMNPVWADELLGRAAKRAGVTLGPAETRIAEVDERASKSRAAIARRVGV